MDAGTLIRALFGGLCLVAVVGIFVVRATAKRRRQQAADRALARGRFTLRVDPEATFEGLKTGRAERARWRRGKGVLILTERKIRYDEFLPAYRFEVEIRQVRAVDTNASFLGKVRGKPVLAIHFMDASGTPADVGFTVTDPGSWAIQIRKGIAT